MATDAQIAEVRAANLALTGKIEADLAKFWRYVDLSKPETARNALLNFVPLLVQRYGDMASTISADWFEELRFDAIDQGFLGRLATSTSKSFTPKLAVPDLVAVTSEVRFIAGDLFTDAPETALAKLQATSTRRVLQVGRETTRLNTFARGSGARGWARATRPGACRFCRALAARGGVFTQETVRFASHAPKCNCVSVPVFDKSAPEVDVMAYVASANTSKMTPVQQEKQRARVSAWLEKSFPGEADHAPAA
ncbi:MAG: hypothetical protein ACOH10_11330 [Rhodoglobus sp.]